MWNLPGMGHGLFFRRFGSPLPYYSYDRQPAIYIYLLPAHIGNPSQSPGAVRMTTIPAAAGQLSAGTTNSIIDNPHSAEQSDKKQCTNSKQPGPGVNN